MSTPSRSRKAMVDLWLRSAVKKAKALDAEGRKRAKDVNPKDLIGQKKVPLGLLPAAGAIYGAMAMRDGARKYGPYNWRAKKVLMTVYLDAIQRHALALQDGEDVAPDSGVHHLGHIIACGSLLADAVEGGFVVDDRPAPGPAAAILDRFYRQQSGRKA